MSAEALTMSAVQMDAAEHNEGQEATNGVFNSLLNSRPGKMVTGLMVSAGLVGVGEGIAASTASAASTPVAHEASGGWTVYGGEPLVPGGVNSRNQFVAEITSSTGQGAMHYMGLNSKEIGAIDTGAREGKETLRHFAFGTEFKKMSFGINGASVDTNVSFEDPRYPNGFDAYDLQVAITTTKAAHEKIHGKTVAGKETTVEHLEIDVATKCGNIALLKKYFTHKFTPGKMPKKPAPKPPVPPAPVVPPTPTPETPTPSCNGDTTNSGTNSGNGGQAQGGNCSTNINCSAIESPNAVVCSPSTPGTPVTPPPEQFPPSIAVQQKTPGFEGGNEGDQIEICAVASSNPASDGVTVTAVDKYSGNLSVSLIDGEYCALDTLVNTPETDDDVVFTATDKVNGLTATDDTGAFPVRQPQ